VEVVPVQLDIRWRCFSGLKLCRSSLKSDHLVYKMKYQEVWATCGVQMCKVRFVLINKVLCIQCL